MAARNDAHRPSAIQVEDYRFVALGYQKDACPGLVLVEREAFRCHEAKTGATWSKHQHGGSCHVCGAHALYTAIFHHTPSNTYIRTGLECAEHLFDGDEDSFRARAGAFRTSIQDWNKCRAGKNKAIGFLSEQGIETAWVVYEGGESVKFTDERGNAYFEENTIRDIVGKLVKYGNISERQVNFVRILLGKIADRTVRRVQWEAKKLAAKPVPTFEGRARVEGTVVSTKVVESDFGTTLKMLVETVDGWKTWGTVPRDLDVARGVRVSFEARVEVSRDDEKFSFFSRPTKARVLEAA